MLVEPLIRKFANHLDRERGLSPRTQENYNRSLCAVCDRIDRGLRRRPGIVRKGLELKHLTRVRLQREISRSADGSVRIVACAVRAFFRFLLLRGVIKDDIGQRLLGRQVKRERSRFFTEAQAFQLLDSPRIKTPQTRQQEVQAVRDCALLAIMYEAGLRSGEVCGLDVDSVSWDSPKRGCAILRVMGKGRKERDVVVRASVRPLKDWLSVRAEMACPGERALFVMVRKGRRLTRWLLWSTVRSRGLTAGIPGAHPHRFRHSCATHMIWGGADLFVVQDLLGHQHLETTRLYAATDPRRVIKQGLDRHPMNRRARREKGTLHARREKGALHARREKGALHARRA